MTRQELMEIRRAFADYLSSEGCSCCQNVEKHAEAAQRLGILLKVPRFSDGSGYDFWKFKTGAERKVRR